jgi:hypothetical protein
VVRSRYFHNAQRDETTWQHPLDPYFKQLVAVGRMKQKEEETKEKKVERG